jgi:large conductance mechanosensitive channel
MKKFFEEFKVFISRGNVIDLAVGMIVGSAFTSIVNSLVKDVVMPFVSIIIGGISFADLKYVITPAEGDVAECAILYGNFIQQIVNFLIIALVVFSLVKAINTMRAKLEKKEEEPAPEPEPEEPSEEILLLREIRDSLKK